MNVREWADLHGEHVEDHRRDAAEEHADEELTGRCSGCGAELESTRPWAEGYYRCGDCHGGGD